LFNLPEDVQVFCNRGTSGFDGSVSTAVGAAYASELPTILITGDLSLFYDSNGLWNAHIPKTFKIIVINNSGGGIFRILPGEKDTEVFDTFFETKHQLTAIDLARMYKFKYRAVTSENELEASLQLFYEDADGPAMLEIITPDQVNDLVLLEYFKYIK
ncbi:MAG: 2-succinyl-5-enolpyruvyl-6-hydroxy-3-cyclohexene-1-carboxylate synthase, partial [Bacteroidetes bacterium]|nr:2-succinyl-5-enolpyruvyl-6-hydroxy-3-cyclohexene-1-carboxylate synthase [Bacteroidota bacterium]